MPSFIDRINSRLFLALLAGGLMVGMAGCQQRSAKTDISQTEKPDEKTARQRADGTTVTEIEDQLRSALFQLQPEHLNIDSRLDDAISVLNNWWAAVESAKLQPVGIQPAAIPTERLPAELLTKLQRKSYDANDGQYIRACYLAHHISEQATAQAGTELERIVKICDWVHRNIGLRAADEIAYPVTFYEATLFGRATAADRAVAIATILKQLRLDSLIVSPSAEQETADNWLLGVVLQDQVYLFDPRLGLPVPRESEDGQAAFDQPATLQELQQHPEWLKFLTSDDGAPPALTAEQLKQPRIQAISFPNSWAPRIWAIEQMLPGDQLCVLYDAPARIDQLPGVFERVANAVPGTSAGDVALWQYPLVVEERLRTPDAGMVRALQLAIVPFIVPVEFERDGPGGEIRRVETMRQLRIRIGQLFGQRNDSIAQYVTIRQLSVQLPPDPQLGPVYQRAADDAFYWSCVCKFENGDYDSAVKSLADYLRRYRRTGQWRYDARLLLAQAQWAKGERDEAQQTVRVQDSDDPYRERLAIMAQTWSAEAAK